MTYDELKEELREYENSVNYEGALQFALAHNWEFEGQTNFLSVHAEDKMWYPILGSGLSVLFEVKDVSTETKFGEPCMKLELYEPYSDTTFNARLLHRKDGNVQALKFRDKNHTLCWVLLSVANITKEPCFPSIDKSDLLDQIGRSFCFTLHPERIVDMLDEVGKDGKDFLQEYKLHRLAYKDVYEKVLYCMCDDDERGDMICASAEACKGMIAALAQEKKKIKITIGGVEYVFANAEEARAVLGTNVDK